MTNILANCSKKYGIWAIAALLILWGNDHRSLLAQNIISGDYNDPPVESLRSMKDATKPAYVDMNDYYYLSNGEIASFLRSKNTYVLIHNRQSRVAAEFADSIEAQFVGQVRILERHAYGNHVRIDVEDEHQKQSIISSIYENYPAISYISPMLVRVDKGTTLAVQPQITVRISTDADSQHVIESLQTMKLQLVSKLKFTDAEFKFAITETISDVGRIFEITREIANLPYVDWAEPDFLTTADKMFTPNDPLFNQQWHLKNTGQNGGVAGADVDASKGWDISKGNGAIIAVYDDGVQMSHPDLPIWSNPGETGGGKETNGIDDDGNGFIDDYRGWDFTDGDNDPSPATISDNHGTAVAGVAGARGNNGLGVSGGAVDAFILPVRMTSGFCSDYADAMRYAGKYGDVVNNSWGIGACESQLDSAIADVVSGNIPGARRGNKGTPVLFATGNSASGWVKFTLTGIPTGSYTYHWKFDKDVIFSEGYDTVWLDNIVFPDGASVNFESDPVSSIPNGFTSDGNATWSVVSDGVHARGASGKSVKAGTITDSQETNLYRTYSHAGTGTLTFWAWISCEQDWDFFEFYVGSTLFFRFAPGQGGHINEVGYPASNPDTIAVGGTNDGSMGGVEERTHYSQFGPEVDVVACTSGIGAQGITTTDRTGSDGYDTGDYTDTFGGTSSATPLVAGVVANLLTYMPDLTAAQVRQKLHEGAEKIGPYAYPGGRNDFYGYGRVNLFYTLGGSDNGAPVMAPMYLPLILGNP
jgi:subtilisin family serine protease